MTMKPLKLKNLSYFKVRFQGIFLTSLSQVMFFISYLGKNRGRQNTINGIPWIRLDDHMLRRTIVKTFLQDIFCQTSIQHFSLRIKGLQYFFYYTVTVKTSNATVKCQPCIIQTLVVRLVSRRFASSFSCTHY